MSEGIDLTRSIGALAMVIRDRYPDVSNAVLAMGAAAAVNAAKAQIEERTERRVRETIAADIVDALTEYHPDYRGGAWHDGMRRAAEIARGGAA